MANLTVLYEGLRCPRCNGSGFVPDDQTSTGPVGSADTATREDVGATPSGEAFQASAQPAEVGHPISGEPLFIGWLRLMLDKNDTAGFHVGQLGTNHDSVVGWLERPHVEWNSAVLACAELLLSCGQYALEARVRAMLRPVTRRQPTHAAGPDTVLPASGAGEENLARVSPTRRLALAMVAAVPEVGRLSNRDVMRLAEVAVEFCRGEAK